MLGGLLGWGATAPHAAYAEPAAPPKLLPPGPDGTEFPDLHNLIRVTDRVYSGAEPESDLAFEELARLGIKTIVSVDGARPDVDAARQRGLRYVHIPFGYDGVDPQAGLALARVMRDVEGPIYFHCHHGAHRGPAAAAIACIASGAADGDSALAVLERAGTSKGYAGLWRDVKAFQPPAAGVRLPELVEVAEVGSLASAMAAVDRASDNLKLCQAAGWKTPADHPDIDAGQQALLLREGLHETGRLVAEDNPHDARFARWMAEAERGVVALEAAIASGENRQRNALFQAVQSQCQQCHLRYRN
ncbi:protein-tyrosine phosphatase family protein [Pirellulimonas nuda]|uniref:cytochrome c n=1 Tax=Pirellulimonas nuda TaxID=2528009 RepID=UPI00119D9FB9|nr:cytochrome c [Pirellulimonas nuda]